MLKLGRNALLAPLCVAFGYGISSLIPTESARAQPALVGDVDGDGIVDFSDIVMIIANWQTANVAPGGWDAVRPHVVRVYQQGVQSTNQTGSIVVLNLDADDVMALIGLPQNRRGGVRGVSGVWPAWPPVGSALETLMDQYTHDDHSVELAAQAVLQMMQHHRPGE